MTYSVSPEAVFKTAPGTPGLLIKGCTYNFVNIKMYLLSTGNIITQPLRLIHIAKLHIILDLCTCIYIRNIYLLSHVEEVPLKMKCHRRR